MINGRGDYKNEYTKWLFNKMFVLGSLNSVGQNLFSRTFKKITARGSNLHGIESSFLEKDKNIK